MVKSPQDYGYLAAYWTLASLVLFVKWHRRQGRESLDGAPDVGPGAGGLAATRARDSDPGSGGESQAEPD